MTTLAQAFTALAAAALLAGSAGAAELAPGAAIDKTNLDRVKDDTFEGKTIGSMLPERLEWQIRHHGLVLTLRKSEPTPPDPRVTEATARYAGEVRYDPAKNEVTGYRAGLPFPQVDPADPHVAQKLIWNFYYASPVGQVMDFRKFAYLLIDGKRGLERTQHWSLIRYFMKNRLTGPKAPVDGSGSEFSRTLLFANYPQDLKGLGTFTVRYDSAQFEDQWAYLKTARRTRRLSSGAWMDPIGGTDQLNDDIEVWNARPSWYKGFRYLGRRWVLAVAHGSPAWNESKRGTPEEFPTVDLSSPPFWNPKDGWEPREVHVVETTPPDQHPYSKKVVYMDVQIPRIYFGEVYDKKGEFWKWMVFNGRPLRGEDGVQTYVSNQGHTIDFKRNHATIFVSHPSWRTNTPLSAGDVSLTALEAAGQ